MVYKDSHPSDQDLLLAADGELTPRRQSEVRLHLQACWSCRNRMAEVESTIQDFVTGYHLLLDPLLDSHIPSGDRSEALLRNRLVRQFSSPRRAWPIWASLAACACMVLGLAAVTLAFTHFGTGASIPNPKLTPGEAATTSRLDVCQTESQAATPEIPAALKDAVFSEYGMKDAQRNAYEVDFLITPGLGGTAGIRNLWPQPYSGQSWNAHTKDALENRLHTLVCSGDLDLSTAQHDIAANWVTAYKKYVATAN